jgi:hypothetical protein
LLACLPVSRLAAGDDSSAAKSADRIDFARDVRPILVQHCHRCHGDTKRQGGLRLTNRREAVEAADSGRVAIKPGRADDSELIRRLTVADEDERMPLGREPLAAREIDLLRRWIDAGAVWPDETESSKRHWAYIKPTRPAIPQIQNPKSKIQNPIDAFVLDRLAKEGLQPSPAADRARLIRRVSLDLIGLPPTPDEVAAFEADARPDAYERLVDRLLASPHYGEKWASHWLDLARYADSNGFQRDGFRDVWPYRDWVVRAFNADMPFDQFTIEQIAGDLLVDNERDGRSPPLTKGGPGGVESRIERPSLRGTPPAPPSEGGETSNGDKTRASLDRLIATGFHRCTTVNVEAGTDQEENRVNAVFDRVNTTGLVWLGTTLECAQCHNHKYDPISQREYYQLFAFFNNTAIETRFQSAKATAALEFDSPTAELPDPAVIERRGEIDRELASLSDQTASRQSELRREQPAAEDRLRKELANAEQWHVLDIADFDSLGDQAGFKLLNDGSLLVTGDPPDKDTYTITVHTKLTNVTGFKLETLTDPSLPGSGPGRGDAERPNFVLHAFRVSAKTPGVDRRAGGVSPRVEPATGSTDEAASNRGAHAPRSPESNSGRIKLTNAQADFSQAKFDVSGAIDDDPRTAWAINPKFHQPHHATFDTVEPVGAAEGTTLTFVLEQNFGSARTIGRLRLSARTGKAGGVSVPADVAAILRDEVQRDREGAAPAEPNAARASSKSKNKAARQEPRPPEANADKKPKAARLAEYLESLDAPLRKLRERHDDLNRQAKALASPRSLVMRELPEPRETAMFRRGNFLDRAEPVQPGVPLSLHPLPDGPLNRLTLAQWIASPDNPLVARVTVNRWWAEFFGRGLVATLEDFGSQGDRPTHLELLDWLACEFVEPSIEMETDAETRRRGDTESEPMGDQMNSPRLRVPPSPRLAAQRWGMKHIHRLIVTSATYRQASRVTPELMRRDDRNELLARGPRFRLSAEAIRDHALAVSGLLSKKLGGPPVRPFQPEKVWNVTGVVDNTYRPSEGEDAHRRGLYVVWRRSAPYPSFINFDAPTRTACVVKRSRSNTPQQALTLLNDPVYVEATKALTRRMLIERPTGTASDRIRHGFRLVVSREPTANEVRLLSDLVREQATRLERDPAAVREVVGSVSLPDTIQPADFAAWYAVATVLMNLDEAITKG